MHRGDLDQKGMRYLAEQRLKRAGMLYTQRVQVQAPQGQRGGAGVTIENDAGGYEVMGPGFRACIGDRAYTRREGTDTGTVHVFPQLFDFLSYIEFYDLLFPDGDVFILHRLAHVEAAIQEIQAKLFKTHIVLWLGNVPAGEEVQNRFFQAFENVPVATMNYLYEGFPSLHTWWRDAQPPTRSGDQVKHYHDTAWTQLLQSRKPN